MEEEEEEELSHKVQGMGEEGDDDVEGKVEVAAVD